MSMEQKLYARALEPDEVFIAVEFLDVGVHVTSLTATKNFLLIGDALQSVTLLAFQEDPYKLVLLGRDYRRGLSLARAPELM
ncbi:BZ3500_MvSof-1268-A1-R1_Chr1-3g02440 [Microbotryum saponariae]|uniref:BZ3500_MvSof-1268-A1-R1_Chr1-3g02440 protein n=1 Tax=Microbotryum saponariae TaxID=289078 RepID=A0A2X0KEW1_9BASI|nr:BZ3500_MvSof-1268-A1-R1_Chr1-3g02440 [Microbotryum saponariae]SCZ96235.1 BZ3501_MvSof-1269-A2-R1_Chr1-3g02043 [Microbotryum saponariae]